MAGMPSIFMEDTYVGGVPYFTKAIAKYLPKNKKKRDKVYSIQMIILTYSIYSFYNMARRPLAVVKAKIIEECEIATTTGNGTFNVSVAGTMYQYNTTGYWCESVGPLTTQTTMGILDSTYILSYGIFLFMSGVVADCYNPRFYLTAGCALSGIFCALMGLSDYWGIRSYQFMGMTLILFGAFQSTGWPVVLSCVTFWYNGGARGTFFGIWNTHNYLGSILGIFLAGWSVDKNWGWSFFLPGFILAFMSLVVFFCMVADPGDLKELDKEKEKAKKPKPSRRITEMEIPPWLSTSRSIKMYDALLLPGVIEFSASMFFSRMVGYIFLFWLPVLIKQAKDITSTDAAYYSIAYVLGGSLGGIVAGIFVDIFHRSAVVCALFLALSIPVLLVGHFFELGKDFSTDIPLMIFSGLFVEAPYVVTSTSVSADLGTHKMIKRNHRALSTIGGIIEGTGAIGAAIGTTICGFFLMQWKDIIFVMMALQLIAIFCLGRQAYKDFSRKQSRTTLKEYWKSSFFA